MQRNLWIKLGLIIVLASLAILIDIPGGFSKIGIKKEPKLRKGLDLVGGTHLVYEADMSKIAQGDRDSALTSLNNVIDRRINALGVTEPVIQTRKFGDTYGIIVELPGIQNIDEALSLIGKTAQLVFRESPTGDYQNWQDTDLTGQHLKKAEASIDQQGNP
jgi:preprotein translocase subunit SecD